MHAEVAAQLAFHLTGRELAPVQPFALIPALLARYRDLAALRYDFPVVLEKNTGEVFSLSRLVDKAIDGKDEKTRKLALRCERNIRSSKSKSLDFAVPLAVAGELADCDAALPGRLVAHLWRALQEKRAQALRSRIEQLVARLSDILAADFARSDAGRSAERLRASFAAADPGIDFGALSRMLKRALPERPIAQGRRRRIESLIGRLRSPDLGPFELDSCAEALAAYRARLPQLIALSHALAAARLEAAGEYVEARHDALFQTCGASLLAEEGLAELPGTLVRIDGAELGLAENAQLAEMLSIGMPVKVLVQFDDILARSPVGRPGFALRSHALAGMALGLPEVYVLQCCASQLYELRDELRKGLAYPGAALFSVFSGAGGESGPLPPYLVAAAAAESRAFPAFRYDPADAEGERFSLAANPQPDKDWVSHALPFEDAELQRASATVELALADFVACDGRYAGWFAPLARGAAPENLPYVLLADKDNVLHKAIYAEQLAGEARRCLEFWKSLQQRVRKKETPPAQKAVAPAPVPAPAAPPPAVEPEKPRPDQAYIETARCTTCEECVKINDRMFAYNENKQAYISDPSAGTYRELVEAAESCQVSIIHPGKPRDPQEPGLDELLARAEPFR